MRGTGEVGIEQLSAEFLLQRISELVDERQQLRRRADMSHELEANRLEICRRQRQLNHALIARHLG